MSALRARLAQFEKTIKSNEQFECSGASFLSNLVSSNNRGGKQKVVISAQPFEGDSNKDETLFIKKASPQDDEDDTSVTFDLDASLSEFEESFPEEFSANDSDSSLLFETNRLESQRQFLDDLIEVSEEDLKEHAEDQTGPSTVLENTTISTAGNISGDDQQVKSSTKMERTQMLLERSLMESWNSKRLRLARESRRPKQKGEGKCLQDRLKAFQDD